MENPHLHRFLRCMFFVWDRNHRLQAWVFKWVHDEDIFWHISMDFILLDISNGLMDNHDKLQQIWHPPFSLFLFLVTRKQIWYYATIQFATISTMFYHFYN
jgi:hypothetical protein